MSTTLTANQAVQVSREEGVTIADLEEMGFTIITAGQANVQAAQAEVPANEELQAIAEDLFGKGRKGEPTKSGRLVRVLGAKEGLGPYSIVVYRDKA